MSDKAQFFTARRYAIVGGGQDRKFPALTQRYLENSGRQVYAVDLSEDGHRPLGELLDGIPSDTEAVVVEVPKDDTAGVVEALLDRGFDNLWLHQMTETEDAVVLCQSRGASVQTGSCAVMYLAPGLSPHAVHRAIWRLIGRY